MSAVKHSPTLLTVPDIDDYLHEQLADWRRAATLLRGGQISGIYPEGHTLVLEVPQNTPVTSGRVVVGVPFQLGVGDQLVDLGVVYATVDDAEVVKQHEAEDRTVYAIEVPDRQVRYALAPDSDGNATC